MKKSVIEVLGWSAQQGPSSESEKRAYFVDGATPEEAKALVYEYASAMEKPEGWKIEVAVDEEKKANGLFFATITIRSPNTKIKIDHGGGVLELYGEKVSVNRNSTTHERLFRIQAESGPAAAVKLENFVRESMITSDRLHLDSVSVDEEADGDGYFSASVSYSNPDTKTSNDAFTGIVEAYGDRSEWSGGMLTNEKTYRLRNFIDSHVACLALKAFVAGTFPKSVSVEENTEGAYRQYVGHVRWSIENREEEDEEEEEVDRRPTISFSVSGTQTKRMSFVGPHASYAPAGMRPRNFGGLINVTKDGVEGIDIPVAEPSFTETHVFPGTAVTEAYFKLLATAFGKYNAVPFRTFGVAEVMLIDANLNGYKIGDRTCTITFKFLVSPTITDFPIGSGKYKITIPRKRGFDAVSVHYEKRDFPENQSGTEGGQEAYTLYVPTSVDVGPVYYDFDFSMLGL